MVVIAVLAGFMLGAQATGQGSTPENTYKGLDLCNYARVKQPQSSSYLNVRSGPGTQFRKLDQLPTGTVVYVCDEQGDWVNIFYGKADTPCGVVLRQGLNAKKAQDCKSGWANRKWIEIISG
jgi:uncharacterized protein YgiM (DUF1202 family)